MSQGPKDKKATAPTPVKNAPPVGRVGLFVTCLIDAMRPQIAEAAVILLSRQKGLEIDVPALQSCCGQPAYNAGDIKPTLKFAALVIKAFGGFDYVVVPSGSCAGMIKHHLPKLTRDHAPDLADPMQQIADKTWELADFLVTKCHYKPDSWPQNDARFQPAFADGWCYHDSCSSLREMGVKDQPRQLMKAASGRAETPMDGQQNCCGFGGLFSVKYGEISNKMVSDKTQAACDSGAGVLLAGDLGCLLNIAGKLSRDGSPLMAYHFAEYLVFGGQNPALGQAGDKI